jgi:hypothetical protein
VQAARSGNKILRKAVCFCYIQGNRLKLTNVARASLEELLLDYEDFLRTNKLKQWDKNHRFMIRFRELNRIPNATYETYRKAIEHEDSEICTM